MKSKKNTNKEFPEFWYESGDKWGWVTSFFNLAQYAEFQIKFGSDKTIKNIDDFLDKSMRFENNDDDDVNFGTRREHKSNYSLRQFLADNEVLEDFLKFWNNVKS